MAGTLKELLVKASIPSPISRACHFPSKSSVESHRVALRSGLKSYSVAGGKLLCVSLC